jgi:hypothetical protein
VWLRDRWGERLGEAKWSHWTTVRHPYNRFKLDRRKIIVTGDWLLGYVTTVYQSLMFSAVKFVIKWQLQVGLQKKLSPVYKTCTISGFDSLAHGTLWSRFHILCCGHQVQFIGCYMSRIWGTSYDYSNPKAGYLAR